MTINLIIVVPGVALLLTAAFAGLVTIYGRRSEEHLVAPRNAGFGQASRLVRAEATREQARADLRALTAPKANGTDLKPGPALVLVDDTTEKANQRAA